MLEVLRLDLRLHRSMITELMELVSRYVLDCDLSGAWVNGCWDDVFCVMTFEDGC